MLKKLLIENELPMLRRLSEPANFATLAMTDCERAPMLLHFYEDAAYVLALLQRNEHADSLLGKIAIFEADRDYEIEIQRRAAQIRNMLGNYGKLSEQFMEWTMETCTANRLAIPQKLV